MFAVRRPHGPWVDPNFPQYVKASLQAIRSVIFSINRPKKAVFETWNMLRSYLEMYSSAPIKDTCHPGPDRRLDWC
jgi:hypothetical protein